MDETPAGIEQVRALVAAFRAVGARSVNIYESVATNGRLMVNIQVVSDDKVRQLAAESGMPTPREAIVDLERQPGVKCRWLTSWSHIDGMSIDISGPQTVYPAPSVAQTEEAA